jgi:DNA-binding FadR family transcriptional regulator
MFHTSDALIRNVHSQVADRVGMSIVRGDVGVGETLPSEMQICEMMDVSRTVVREAIRTLTGKGLVKPAPKAERAFDRRSSGINSIPMCCAGGSKPPTWIRI